MGFISRAATWYVWNGAAKQAKRHEKEGYQYERGETTTLAFIIVMIGGGRFGLHRMYIGTWRMWFIALAFLVAQFCLREYFGISFFGFEALEQLNVKKQFQDLTTNFGHMFGARIPTHVQSQMDDELQRLTPTWWFEFCWLVVEHLELLYLPTMVNNYYNDKYQRDQQALQERELANTDAAAPVPTPQQYIPVDEPAREPSPAVPSPNLSDLDGKTAEINLAEDVTDQGAAASSPAGSDREGTYLGGLLAACIIARLEMPY